MPKSVASGRKQTKEKRVACFGGLFCGCGELSAGAKCGARGKRRKNQDGQRRANSADYKMRCARLVGLADLMSAGG